MKKLMSIMGMVILFFGLIAAVKVSVTNHLDAQEVKNCWCCVDGKVVNIPMEECRKKGGICFKTREAADKYCSVKRCWCCIDGKVVFITPEECKKKEGRCFETKEEAYKYCKEQ